MLYDLEYFEKMLRINSATAREICGIRWEFISTANPEVVLDYGSGVGWFRAYRPEGVEVFTYDIAAYPQTGIDIRVYDVVCFWDVLEHIPDFEQIEPVLRLADHVAVSVPVKPEGVQYFGWKHLKPEEHVHFFTEEILDALFESYNFRMIKTGNPECPPRADILSVLYQRR